MKLHLPKLLLTAVLTAIGATASHADDSSTSYTLGDVMYVGDSITHGVNSASYRWALHKILVDNGITYTEVGYTYGNHSDDNGLDDFTPSSTNSYGGVIFKNIHSAASSQRAFNTAGRTDTDRLDHTSIQNWLGVSTVDSIDPTKKMNGDVYSGSVSKPDTFVLMLGTNDLLSEPSGSSDYIATPENLKTRMDALLGSDFQSGDMGTIVDTMYQSNPDAKVYVSTIPCWADHTNNTATATREAVVTYNEALKNWANNYNLKNNKKIVLVDVNRGLVDVTQSTFYGVSDMFNAADGHSYLAGDMLHPNAQGDLIIAGNMARAMGIAGRTAGAERKAAENFQNHWTLNTINNGSYSWKDKVTPTGGFTAELQGFSLGNGAVDGWNTSDNFSFTMGNGSIAGTLNINEGYIQWGSSVIFSSAESNAVLFSADMSTLNENIRMAYITGDSDNGINSGFYVWLGDMLIGEALQGTSSTTNGVYISYSDTITHSLTLFGMDSTGAYAPTSNLYYLISALSAAAQGVVTVPTIFTQEVVIKSASDAGQAMDGITTTSSDVVVATIDSGDSLKSFYANQGARTAKEIWATVNSGKLHYGWYAAHNTNTYNGNISLIFAKDFKGTSTFVQNSTGGSFLGVLKGTVNGDVTFQFDAPNAKIFTGFGTNISIAGAYEGNINGNFNLVINDGYINGLIYGGNISGANYKIRSSKIYVNGGVVNDDIYGGGSTGAVGSSNITVTGGIINGNIYGGGSGGEIGYTEGSVTYNGSTSVTITGGTIGGDIYAGGSGGTIKGNTALTIDGNLPTLHGKLLSAGGSNGTINGNASLTIKNASANNYIASIDKFTGTLSGGANVSGSSTLVFDNSQLSGTAFDSVTVEYFDSINLTNGSNITLGATSLDGANGSTISLTGDSHLTVEGDFSSAAGLSITGASGSVTLAGQNNTFGGVISVAEGNSLTLSGNLAFNIEGGNFNITHRYDPERTTNGLGNVTISISGLENLLTGSINTDAVTKLTVNGSIVDKDALASATSEYIKENAVYYAVNSAHNEAPSNPLEQREATVYSLGDGTEILMSEVVHVGKHELSGPAVTEGANSAQAFYVGENGVLCIMGDSDTMLAGDILETTEGNGKIFLRSPGYTDLAADVHATTLTVEINSSTKASGSLYLAPYEINQEATPVGQPGVNLHLEDGADVTSFKEINYGYPKSQIMINGHIEANAEGVHINSLNALGCGTVYFAINQAANQEIQLGNVTITSYEHGNGTIQPGKLYIDINHSNSHVVIQHLAGGETVEGIKQGANGTIKETPYLYLSTGKLGNYGATAESINGVLDIDSFDYRGYLWLWKSLSAHKLHVNINLRDEQWLNDYQYGRYPDNVNSTLTIKGSGKYILSEGNSIKDNIGLLSTEYAEDGVTRIWTGTVEVNNLAATDGWNADSTKNGLDFSLYGNEQSTVHFKGFKGYLTDDDAAVEIKSDLILENTDVMNGYEITGGDEGQVQTYTGAISGTGDFVVSAGSNMTFNLQGDLSEWKGGAELKVTGGTQAVNFSGEATEVNADIAVADTAKLNMSVGTATDTAHTTTFNGKVKASSLTTYSGTTAEFAGAETKIGNVNISSRDKENAAVIRSGMKITDGSTVSGGEASNAVLAFDSTAGSLSNAKLTGVSLCALQASASIKMQGIVANDVYLAGATNFESLDEQTKFVYQGIVEAFDKDYNEVYFESTSFNGMTLDKELTGTITLTVSNEIAVSEGAAMADVPTNVSILLKGFTVEGLTLGKRMEGVFDPLKINIMDGAQVAALSEDTVITVGQLLNYKDYQEVYYVQQADGLLIRMSNIPEPTTATLSLLALTALAARRRRRK